MNTSELAIFGILGTSVIIGIYQMGKDAFRVYNPMLVAAESVDSGTTDNDRRERALSAINGKCNIHLQNFGHCAQENQGMLVFFKCRTLNNILKECLLAEQGKIERVADTEEGNKEEGGDDSWSNSPPTPRRYS
jgi:hypothetical protein